MSLLEKFAVSQVSRQIPLDFVEVVKPVKAKRASRSRLQALFDIVLRSNEGEARDWHQWITWKDEFTIDDLREDVEREGSKLARRGFRK